MTKSVYNNYYTAMSDELTSSRIDISNSLLYENLKNCANLQSSESLSVEYLNDVFHLYNPITVGEMISNDGAHSTSGNISTNTSYLSDDDNFGVNILEDNGRISLAYENLRTIPRRIANTFAAHTKCLDLSYNDFQNLSFLSFFDELHTLILDRNYNLDVNTLPYLPNLKILWINNCDITNLTCWVKRIEEKCPLLEQLSAMNNNTPPNYYMTNGNENTKSPSIPMPPPPSTWSSDYQEYILHLLPALKYLDGVARSVYTKRNTNNTLNNSRILHHKTKIDNRTSSSNKNSSVFTTTTINRKTSMKLNLKNIFQLHRKNNYQSSSS